MTKKERLGLEHLTTIGANYANGALPEVKAAIDWIQRQMAIDERRRKKRGHYRGSKRQPQCQCEMCR